MNSIVEVFDKKINVTNRLKTLGCQGFSISERIKTASKFEIKIKVIQKNKFELKINELESDGIYFNYKPSSEELELAKTKTKRIYVFNRRLEEK